MSICLIGFGGKKKDLSNIGWAFYLNLASSFYGWIEAGTDAPDDWDSIEEWAGHYDWSAGQKIRGDDARSLAKALEAYLIDPERNKNTRALAQDLSRVVGFEVVADSDDQSFVSDLIAVLKDAPVCIF